MMEEKMKRMRRATRKHSRWKRYRDVLMATAHAAKAFKAADAAAAKKADDDAAAKKAKKYAGAKKIAHEEGDAGKGNRSDKQIQDASMKPVMKKGMKTIKKLTTGEAIACSYAGASFACVVCVRWVQLLCFGGDCNLAVSH